MDRITQALAFATLKHAGQFRKDGVTPYITHPIGVANITRAFGGNDDQYIIALLHDCVEDCECTVEEVREVFGDFVADGVDALTNTSKITNPELNRAGRKAMDNARVAKIADAYKFVKLADIYYNVNDLKGLKAGFAIKFLNEKRVQADAVRGGNLPLYNAVLISIQNNLVKMGERVKVEGPE